MTLLQSIRTAAIQTEPVGVTIRQGFLDGIQTQQVSRLHGSEQWVVVAELPRATAGVAEGARAEAPDTS